MHLELLMSFVLALLWSCAAPYEGPEPFEPLPVDPRLGEAVFESFAGRGARFMVGAGSGGQAIADLRPAGFELAAGGGLEWHDAESALYWLADGAMEAERLEGELPATASRLGVSLRPREVVAAASAGGTEEIYVVRDGARRTLTAAPGALGGPWLVLGPGGEVLAGEPDRPLLCGESGCRPAWQGSGRVPIAWTERGFLLAWVEAREVCAGWAPEGGSPEAPACAALPFLAPAGRAVFAGWQGADAPQVLVEILNGELQAVKAYTLVGGTLEEGDVLASCAGLLAFGPHPFDRVTVAPGASTLFVHETPSQFSCPGFESWTDFPRLNRVEDGIYAEMAWPFSYAQLTCACDRRTDPSCGCWPRAVPPRAFPSLDGTTLRVFSFEEDIEGMTRLSLATHPLPQARSPYYDDACARTCGDFGSCFLNYDLTETCAMWNPYFNAESGVPVAGFLFDVDCADTPACFDVQVEATAVEPADAYLFEGARYPLDYSDDLTPYELFVEADTVWDITVRRAGYQPSTLAGVRAPGPAEGVVLPTFVLRR